MNTTHQPVGNPEHATRKLLIIGDWLFDENWVTGEHRGAISSRIGHQHLRALHDYDKPLCRLAGAGETASILHHALRDHAPSDRWHILGAGVWDQKDTAAIETMLALGPGTADGQSQYRITRNYPGRPCTAQLFNLGDIVHKKHQYRCGTERAIRIYRHKHGRVEIKERIDWEPPIFDDQAAWIGVSEQSVLNSHDLNQHGLRDFVKGITDIVVQDMNKGVVSAGLVEWLTDVAPHARWFVSTKAWRPVRDPEVPQEEPDWLRELERENADVRLLVIPHDSAQRAVDEGDLSRWIIADNGVPSRRALRRTDELVRQFPKAAIIVLPESFTVLARAPESNVCIVQCDAGVAGSSAVGAPMSPVFFPAITAHLLNERLKLEDALKLALSFTHRRWEIEVEQIEHSEQKRTDDSKKESEQEHSLAPIGQENRFGRWLTFDTQEITREWDQAFKECGIMDGKRPYIQLWPAMTDVPGYICCVPSKSDAIRRIRRELALFKKQPRHSKSFMLMASPGSGKSHLVKQLAKSHGLSLVQFNITQMLSKNDILDCFDTIVTRKAQDDQQLLVFFDEINACLNGHHVYDTFLAPLEDNVYVRGGKTFQIPPCAWLFAGTDNPADHPDKATKGSDFVSRLSIPPIDFKPEAGEESDLNTERVYLGVSLLKQAFPDVKEVSEKVLRAFEFLRPDVDVRQIKHLVNSFSDVQHEKVLSRNIPREQLKALTHPHTSHRHHFDKWAELPERRPWIAIDPTKKVLPVEATKEPKSSPRSSPPRRAHHKAA